MMTIPNAHRLPDDPPLRGKKPRQRWGIPQPPPFDLPKRTFVLVVDEKGEPVDCLPNPRWVPTALLGPLP